MGANEQAGWEQQQVNEERYLEAIRAINNCIDAGAKTDDIKTLCRETGVDVTHTKLGDQIKPKEMTNASH